jgi:oligopeptide transport system permease protein
MSDPASGLRDASRLTEFDERLDELDQIGDTTTVDIGKPRSLWNDAWDDLKHNKLFWFAAVLVFVFVLMALVPSLFTIFSPNKDPRFCLGSLSRQPPSADAWFGYDTQGCDVYARTIYGARPSIMVGVLTTIFAVGVGGAFGILGGFYGGWIDSVTSRFTEIFFAIPLLLGGVLILTAIPSGPETSEIENILKVVLAIGILAWTTIARIMRSSVIQVKNADFVQAARALGASGPRIVRSHLLPNSLAPVIVVAMISLGGYIAAEATLSYLGIGLQPPAVSWGIAISDAATFVRVAPHMLFFPAIFLSATVFAFIVLGDAVRDALDPKLR